MAQHPALTIANGSGALLLAGGFFVAPNALAQSFDCKKATTVVEHAICEDKEIAELDVQLAHDLKELLAAQPAMSTTYRKDEQEWVGVRDHRCTARQVEQTLNDCLVAEYRARLSVIAARAGLGAPQQPGTELAKAPPEPGSVPPAQTRVGASQRAHPRLCQVIADRYRPLAHSHPGEAPLELLARLPNSGFKLGGETNWDNLHAADLAAWAAARKPPFSISPALLGAVREYQEEGGSTDLAKAPGVDFYSFSGSQGSMNCADSLSFVVRHGTAFQIDTPGEPGEEGTCDIGSRFASVNASPVAIVEHYDWRPGMTASIDLWNWNGEDFTYECEVYLIYRPHFSKETLNTWGETCSGAECNELRGASFKLAESAESDPKELQDRSLEQLPAKQKEQYETMDRLFGSGAREPQSNDAFSIPFAFHDRLYLASIGHFAIGWRDYADWSVVFAELNDGKLVLRGAFPVGTWKGDLDEVTVTEK